MAETTLEEGLKGHYTPGILGLRKENRERNRNLLQVILLKLNFLQKFT
jgi:hypothetical protein